MMLITGAKIDPSSRRRTTQREPAKDRPATAKAGTHHRGPRIRETRILTHRIANLINIHNVPSRHILTMTFKNAAAAELKR